MAYSKGTISIPDVTGNITVTVTTVEEEQENLFVSTPQFTASSTASTADEVGINGRLNSAGGVVAYAVNQLVTRYIEALSGDTITVTTDSDNTANAYVGMIGFFDSSKTKLMSLGHADPTWSWSADGKTGTLTIPSDYATCAYVRLCVAYSDISSIEIYKE